jgi:hypothetical protein
MKRGPNRRGKLDLEKGGSSRSKFNEAEYYNEVDRQPKTLGEKHQQFRAG